MALRVRLFHAPKISPCFSDAFIALEQVKVQYCPPDMNCTSQVEQTVQNWKKTLHCQHCRSTGIIPYCTLVPPDPSDRYDPQRDKAMLPQPSSIRPQSHGECILLQCNTTCPIGHWGPHPCQTCQTPIMGLPCCKGMVPLPCHQSLSLYSGHHVGHWSWMHHQHILSPTPYESCPTHHRNRLHPPCHKTTHRCYHGCSRSPLGWNGSHPIAALSPSWQKMTTQPGSPNSPCYTALHSDSQPW